jgi:hypothetical protein
VQRSADSDFIAALESAGHAKFAAAGDCLAPRNIYHAVREGFNAADRLAVSAANPNESDVIRRSCWAYQPNLPGCHAARGCVACTQATIALV